MKTVKAFGKHEMLIMTPEEFKVWMQDKVCYHSIVHWVEEWQGSTPLEKYIPTKSFILPKSTRLTKYNHGYPDKCLGSYVQGTADEEGNNAKGYWEMLHWTASINERTNKINVMVKNKA